MRESLRHCYNSLRRAGHQFEFIVARDRVEVRWALYRFPQLHTLRANMPWGPKHADHFATPSAAAFLYESVIRWHPRRIDYHSALVHRDSVLSRLACGAYRVAISGRRVRRQLLKRPVEARQDWH